MALAKTGNWFHDNPQRGRSNNSALLLRDKTSPAQFAVLMESVKEFGEPGFVWSDSTELIVNPCVEIGLYPVDEETGKTGWQACNLSTINCSKIETEDDFYDFCRAASIIGTLQAGFNRFPYLGEISERIIAREALLGVSMTGIMDRPEICLDPETQRRAAKVVKQANKDMAKKININPAARATCIKPEGTTSCVLGTSSGIHPHHAKRYIRRVQANKMEPIYQHLKKINPKACEESVWSANDSDEVISFCIEVAPGAKTKNQISALELLDYVKSTQKNWVSTGTNKKLCVQPWLTHNVSNTINVKPDEWDEVEKFIYKNRGFFCGISLLPITGDKDYPQAPFTAIYLPSEQVSHYGDASLFASGLIEVALDLWEDNLWAACDALLGLGATPKGGAKKKWIARCKKFADRYFEGDVRKLTYCMKDVYNWKEWVDLKRECKVVDYTEVVEEEDNVEPEQAWACSGNSCELI
jgi:ribonucleoside-diphosphate reductase alpha chain